MRDSFLGPNVHSRKVVYLWVGLLSTVLVKMVLLLVRVYQLFFSPLKQVFFGAACSCRFQPSCSCYAYTAFLRFGFGKGLWLTLCRVLRCHPWYPGGFDPPPSLNRSNRENRS